MRAHQKNTDGVTTAARWFCGSHVDKKKILKKLINNKYEYEIVIMRRCTGEFRSDRDTT